MTEVSVRELKAKLPEYLRRVEAGEEITVTRRGKRVAVLRRDDSVPARTLDEKLAGMQRRGVISWPGRKFTPSGKPVPLRGEGPTISEMILEDRV